VTHTRSASVVVSKSIRSKMIYTSVPLVKQQISSSVFKDHGNGTEAPGPISESRISILTNFICQNASANLAFLWAFTAAFLLDKTIDSSSPINAVQSKTTYTLFETPPLAVTFTGKPADTLEANLAEIGFTRQTLNKQTFYRGPGSDAAVQKLLNLGAQANAYSPLGLCNINGYVCLGIMNRVLHGALGFLATWDKTVAMLVMTPSKVTKDSWREYAITSSEETAKGHFFPYFDGLVLPDKAFTPRSFISTFSKLFGSNGKELINATKSIQSGWVSLSTTPPGLMLSHLMFGISLAISAPGTSIRPVILSNDYCGFVLSGDGVVIFKGNVQYSPAKPEDLNEEISSVNQHDNALTEIANILSSAPLMEDTEKHAPVLPSQLSSHRHIHYFMKNRNLGPEILGKIKQHIDSTRFRENLWEVTDRFKVAVAIEAICEKRFLDVSAPFCLKSAAMFTKDPVYSTLAAFGLTSISLIGQGNNATISVTRNPKFYKNFKEANITGVPVFAKPLQTAYEEMSALMQSGVISFKHGGNDRHGCARIIGMSSVIPFDVPQSKRIIDALIGACVKDKGKRKREQGDIDGDAEEVDLKKKKDVALSVAGLAALMVGGTAPSFGGGGSEESIDMDEDFA